MTARDDTIRAELLRTRNCSCPLGTRYHANNCPDLPGALNSLAALDALLAERDALREGLVNVRRQAEPRPWETPGHPMNRWTDREPVLRIIDEVLAGAGGDRG